MINTLPAPGSQVAPILSQVKNFIKVRAINFIYILYSVKQSNLTEFFSIFESVGFLTNDVHLVGIKKFNKMPKKIRNLKKLKILTKNI